MHISVAELEEVVSHGIASNVTSVSIKKGSTGTNRKMPKGMIETISFFFVRLVRLILAILQAAYRWRRVCSGHKTDYACRHSYHRCCAKAEAKRHIQQPSGGRTAIFQLSVSLHGICQAQHRHGKQLSSRQTYDLCRKPCKIFKPTHLPAAWIFCGGSLR